MRTIIAGSRSITSMSLLMEAIKQSQFNITSIISGGAAGADTLGEYYAQHNNIPCTVMKADWARHGRSAGYKRNAQMAEVADALIALWDGQSKGTKHMIDIAQRLGLKVFVFTPQGKYLPAIEDLW